MRLVEASSGLGMGEDFRFEILKLGRRLEIVTVSISQLNLKSKICNLQYARDGQVVARSFVASGHRRSSDQFFAGGVGGPPGAAGSSESS